MIGDPGIPDGTEQDRVGFGNGLLPIGWHELPGVQVAGRTPVQGQPLQRHPVASSGMLGKIGDPRDELKTDPVPRDQRDRIRGHGRAQAARKTVPSIATLVSPTSERKHEPLMNPA